MAQDGNYGKIDSITAKKQFTAQPEAPCLITTPDISMSHVRLYPCCVCGSSRSCHLQIVFKQQRGRVLAVLVVVDVLQHSSTLNNTATGLPVPLPTCPWIDTLQPSVTMLFNVPPLARHKATSTPRICAMQQEMEQDEQLSHACGETRAVIIHRRFPAYDWWSDVHSWRTEYN
jgi:hypothetical protein